MKMMFILLLAVAGIASILRAEDAPAVTANATNHFQIKGMSCDGCARGIASELKRWPGVISADVTFGKKLAVVAFDTNFVSTQGLKKAIVDAGYGAKLIRSAKVN